MDKLSYDYKEEFKHESIVIQRKDSINEALDKVKMVAWDN